MPWWGPTLPRSAFDLPLLGHSVVDEIRRVLGHLLLMGSTAYAYFLVCLQIQGQQRTLSSPIILRGSIIKVKTKIWL